MSLRPNNPEGGSKSFDQFTDDEARAWIRETTTIQKDNAMFRRPVDLGAITQCAALAKRIEDPGMANAVASTLAYLKANGAAAA